MSVRNLDSLFRPKSVALVGASARPGSVGSVVAHNLLAGDFEGPVMPVNPRHKSIHGVIAYPDAASLPVVPDMAVVCTPPDMVPGVIAELGARGTKGAVIITAGFGEGGSEHGRALQQAALDAARPHLLRIIGPNCLGVLVPQAGLNASFATAAPADGKLAFVAQSGAIVASVIDWADEHGLGFSHLVSLGDMIDVDFGDMLDYLANDPHTRYPPLHRIRHKCPAVHVRGARGRPHEAGHRGQGGPLRRGRPGGGLAHGRLVGLRHRL